MGIDVAAWAEQLRERVKALSKLPPFPPDWKDPGCRDCGVRPDMCAMCPGRFATEEERQRIRLDLKPKQAQELLDFLNFSHPKHDNATTLWLRTHLYQEIGKLT